MKFLSVATSIVACATTVHSVALAQGGPIEECTYTVTSCYPPNVPTKTSTIYEQPGVSTVTKSYDCQGCEDVTIMPKECYGVGLPLRTTTFVFEDAQSTTTTNVCNPTPN